MPFFGWLYHVSTFRFVLLFLTRKLSTIFLPFACFHVTTKSEEEAKEEEEDSTRTAMGHHIFFLTDDCGLGVLGGLVAASLCVAKWILLQVLCRVKLLGSDLGFSFRVVATVNFTFRGRLEAVCLCMPSYLLGFLIY